ncbi:hypothetical protein L3X38_041854 [Prunus dulcis]|uniref:Uncharacterized protein n=1 Tax=Prunus dulcis TaxID=3755 RepID=A0AAD4UTR4_PRUDU|nr:hypothetical protein L3X38_041854 [Prunus dulcis]
MEEDEQSRFSFVYEELGMDDNYLGDIGFDPYEFANVIGDGDQPLYPSYSVLLWTINDFSACENLSGCVVKRYKACPICEDDAPSHRLKNGHKVCYIGHRKWLPINHPYRRQHATFNEKHEYGTPPEPLTEEEVMHMVEDINYIWAQKRGEVLVRMMVRDFVGRRNKNSLISSIGNTFLLRQVLDVMHIEKNVCDSIIGTLLEIPGKK